MQKYDVKGSTPAEKIRDLVGQATALGEHTVGMIDDIEVSAWPQDDPVEVFNAYEQSKASVVPMATEFRKMTTEEATKVVKEIVRKANSEDEIREGLNKAGFNGAAAAISSTRSGPMFMAMVMVWGPKGDTIRA